MPNWKEKVVYQIWPRSFYDSNGDGIGDIQGIIAKLDYIKSLGIDVIWLSPIYKSSNKDYGYDISNYYEINPEFGTMEDFDELLKKAKTKGLAIVMDLVANHTSDEHEWFQKALADQNSPYRNYYIFKKGKDSAPPNNWMSFFGGSAWTYDSKHDEYYLTQFTPNQCDLNWENETVREEIYKIMRFWLDKGVAGFRMDVINAISKAEGLPDKNPHKKGLQLPGDLTLNRPKTHDYLQEMYEKVIKHYDCMALGEGALLTPEEGVLYTNPDRHELQMMFHFDLHNIDNGILGKYDFRKFYRWSVPEFKAVIFKWQQEMEKGNGWTGNYLSNHDQRRHVSKFGNDKEYREESAKAFCLLNFTLRGTPFIYQGEEIGMTDCSLEEDEWRDYEAMNAFKVLQSMMHLPKFMARKVVKYVSRDNSRTPMQWDETAHAGFTKGTPWIRVNPNYKHINVKCEKSNNDSILSFYKNMIKVHKKSKVLTHGSFIPLLENHKQIISYIRSSEKEKLLIVINLTKKPANFNLEEYIKNKPLYVSTKKMVKHHTLGPYEARIYKL